MPAGEPTRLRLSAADQAAMMSARAAQRRRDLSLSADEVLRALRDLHRFADWAGMQRVAHR